MKKKIIIFIASLIITAGAVVSVVVGLNLLKPSDPGPTDPGSGTGPSTSGPGTSGPGSGDSGVSGPSDPSPTPPTPIYHNNFTISKTVDDQTKTVSLGGEIVYNISVTNTSEVGLLVNVTDTIPTYTTYVTGGEIDGNSTISWDITIEGNGTCTVSYTVKVDNNRDLLGGSQIVATTAHAGEKDASCESLYVANTLNKADRKYMAKGIRALAYSESLGDIALLKQMYQHAFSLAPSFSGEPNEILDKVFELVETDDGRYYREMTIPTLYGGLDVDDALDSNFIGDRENLEKRDLIEGDVLLIEHNDIAKVYIYDGKELILLDGGYKSVNTDDVIAGVSNANRFVALRPSINLTETHYSGEMIITDDMTDEQKVLIATIQSYLNRGFRLQYDDTRMNYPYKVSSDKGEYRWQIGQYEPEDYTSQKWGYINCAAFTYDVYRTALGIDLGDLYTTDKLTRYYTNGGTVGEPMYPYYYQPNTSADAEERARVQTEFMETLEVGDLIVVRRPNSSGHVLIYVGNNMAVNSSGGNCAYDDTEVYESSIRYINVDAYLFEEKATNYIFRTDGYINKLCIVRPLDIYEGDISENASNRLNNLDVFAEKLSSHPEGKTVNNGDDVTFMLNITNLGATAKTVSITDIVPTNTTLKTASHNAIIEGNNLSWSVTIEAGETIVVSYVVTATGIDGSYIYGLDTKIGGVRYTCPKIYIKNTLTTAQQETIRNLALDLLANNPNSLSRFGLISEIYKQAGMADPFASVTETEFRSSLFNHKTSGLAYGTNLFELNTSSAYYGMVVDTVYGGRNYFTPGQYTASQKINTNRARLAREHSLIIGDILITKFTSSENCYLYIGGDKFLNINTAEIVEDTLDVGTRLMRMISARHYYCVLRPSQMMSAV